jgi:peptidoglycan biosynthesis protein MviN/MurJ (putative lipid II flippase)
VWRLFMKIAAASAAMGVAAYYGEAWLHQVLPAPALGARLIRVIGGIGAGLGALALSAWALGIDEFGAALRRLLRRA